MVSGAVIPDYVLPHVPWFDYDWEYRRHATVSSQIKASGLLQNITVIFNDTVIDWNHVQMDGDDIRFVFLQDPLVALPYDLNYFSWNNSVIASFTIPFVSNTTDVGFMMYYGNPFASDTEITINNATALNNVSVWGDLYRLLTTFPEISDYNLDISRGLIPGKTVWHKFGADYKVDDNEYTVIWTGPNVTYPYHIIGKLNVTSTDADDTVGGNGLWNVTLTGLDENWAWLIETIQLDGQNNVTTVNSWSRIFRMQGRESGVSGWNEGVIYAGHGLNTGGVPAAVHALIDEEHGQTLMALMSVPVNTTGYITSFYFSSDDDKDIEYELQIRDFGEIFCCKHHIFSKKQNSWSTYPEFVPFRVEEKSDIQMMARGEKAPGVTAGFTIIFVDNTVPERVIYEIVRVDGAREYGSPLDVDVIDVVETKNPASNTLLFLAIVIIILLAIGWVVRK